MEFAAIRSIGDFLDAHPDAIDPIVCEIISGGKRYDAVSDNLASYRLAELRQQAEIQWQSMDVLAVPTTGAIYTVAEVAAEPIDLNTDIEHSSNFRNWPLCAIDIFTLDGWQAYNFRF